MKTHSKEEKDQKITIKNDSELAELIPDFFVNQMRHGKESKENAL